jgi:hypothetical protein
MSGGPVMEDEVFAGVFEGVDEGVCRVPLEADPEGAKPVLVHPKQSQEHLCFQEGSDCS